MFKIMFIIDFDDTLINTHALKLEMLNNLKEVGIPEDLYRETYRQTRNNSDGIITYTVESHAKMLATRGFVYEEVLEALKKSLNGNMEKFVFPDAVQFINCLKKYNKPLVLLSLGEPATQEVKVRSSGLHDYFDRVFIVDSGKIKVLNELFGVEKVREAWFFNDKISESLEVLKEFPDLKVVLKKSDSISEEEYKQSGLKYFNTLTEIQKYVAQSI